MPDIIRHAFPDIAWLKQQVAARAAGWPKVVLHVQSPGCYRPDIKGPVSLFLNLKGRSQCRVDHHTHVVPEGTFFISNQDQPYTLTIEPGEPAETFNIHLGQQFLEQVQRGLLLPPAQLLDDPQGAGAGRFHFVNKLYSRTPAFNQVIRELESCSRQGGDNLRVEELLAQLAVQLVGSNQEVRCQEGRLPGTKKTTRLEVYRRLSLAADYMQCYYAREITLEEMAGVACLSKFHFLRLFQACFHQSPYQFLTRVRLQRAKELLRHCDLPVNAVALHVGFANLSSFSRVFQKHEQLSASHFRERLSRN